MANRRRAVPSSSAVRLLRLLLAVFRPSIARAFPVEYLGLPFLCICPARVASTLLPSSGLRKTTTAVDSGRGSQPVSADSKPVLMRMRSPAGGHGSQGLSLRQAMSCLWLGASGGSVHRWLPRSTETATPPVRLQVLSERHHSPQQLLSVRLAAQLPRISKPSAVG